MKKVLGLIGFPLGHSLSPALFQKRFDEQGLTDWEYRLFPLEDIEALPQLLNNTPGLIGLNVTTPHKTKVLTYVDHIDDSVRTIGAANVLCRSPNQGWMALNTDGMALLEVLSRTRGMVAHKQALILGTGGAAKAAAWALREMDIPYAFVSRKRKKGGITYADLDEPCMSSHTLIIQATPLGMAPARDTCPDLPWDWIGPRHLLMDLVYNPRTTLFMKKGKARGARVMNGLKMLYLQAEFAWNFWHPFADQ